MNIEAVSNDLRASEILKIKSVVLRTELGEIEAKVPHPATFIDHVVLSSEFYSSVENTRMIVIDKHLIISGCCRNLLPLEKVRRLSLIVFDTEVESVSEECTVDTDVPYLVTLPCKVWRESVC